MPGTKPSGTCADFLPLSVTAHAPAPLSVCDLYDLTPEADGHRDSQSASVVSPSAVYWDNFPTTFPWPEVTDADLEADARLEVSAQQPREEAIHAPLSHGFVEVEFASNSPYPVSALSQAESILYPSPKWPANPISISSRCDINRLLQPTLPVATDRSAQPPTTMPTAGSMDALVDLTDEPPSPAESQAQRAAKRTLGQAGASTNQASKRTRRDEGAQAQSGADVQHIESIDLSGEDSAIGDALRKQTIDAVRAQAPSTDKPLRLSNLTCVICMDTPTDLTATSCGTSTRMSTKHVADSPQDISSATLASWKR